MSTPPSGLVSPDNPSGSPPAPEASHPHLYQPSAPTTIPPVWEHVNVVLMKMPPSTAEGQNMRSCVLYHSLLQMTS